CGRHWCGGHADSPRVDVVARDPFCSRSRSHRYSRPITARPRRRGLTVCAKIIGRMQWDDVRYFLILARNGSLSAASRSLRVEHSTVSRRVDALEKDLGVRLFDRLPRGWVLSAEGKDLVEVAQRIEAEALALERAAAGRSAPAGKVRISAPP